MADQSTKTGPISHTEAKEILGRFNASHWNNPGEHARYSIPANPKYDDDIRLAAYIEQSETSGSDLETALRLLGKLLAFTELATRPGASRTELRAQWQPLVVQLQPFLDAHPTKT